MKRHSTFRAKSFTFDKDLKSSKDVASNLDSKEAKSSEKPK